MSSPQSKARVIGLTRPLKDVTVTAGETATFECELSYEGIAVEWFLGGTKLEPSDRVSPNTPESVLTMFLYHENRPRHDTHFLKPSGHIQDLLTLTYYRSYRVSASGSDPRLFPVTFVHNVQFSLHQPSASACLHIRACWWRIRIPAEHSILVLR